MVDVFLDQEEKEYTLRVNKVLNEQDLFPLHEAHIVCKQGGLMSTTKGQLKLKKKTLKLLEPEAQGQLYQTLFIAFFRKYNIGYTIGMDLDWLQQAVSYALYPLQQHANKWIDPAAHTAKWLHPMVLERLENEVSQMAYTSVAGAIERYFIEPFEKWGLLEVKRIKQGYSDKVTGIRKTPLFDAFIRFES